MTGSFFLSTLMAGSVESSDRTNDLRLVRGLFSLSAYYSIP